MSYDVQIVDKATGEVVESYIESSEHNAEKCRRGMSINLNHAKYFTRIVKRPRPLTHGGERSE